MLGTENKVIKQRQGNILVGGRWRINKQIAQEVVR